MTEQQFIPKPYSKVIENGQVTWQSPSNIALIKYWGKKKDQVPENPSISFTLSQCKTETTLSFTRRESTDDFDFEVYFEGEKKDDFKSKIQIFFERIEVYMPFLKSYHFKIDTHNTFPHSSGIASSASGMSAIALCLMYIERQLCPDMTMTFFNQKASFLARLGSGSACRSIEGDLIVWGQTDAIEGSSDLFGIKYPYQVDAVFKTYQDTILLVDKGEKQVSSTVGHDLMFNHPFAQQRFEQAHHNMEKFKVILEKGDLAGFIALVESEALTLHAMMMTSMPYFILMKPNTLEVINKIWKFRQETGLHLCFTLDAGANVHLLYPKNETEQTLKFIKTELAVYCQNEHYICDEVGIGASKL